MELKIGSQPDEEEHGDGQQRSPMIRGTLWNCKLLYRDPTLDPDINTRRRQARPSRRWTDDIADFVKVQTFDAPPHEAMNAVQETSSRLSKRDRELTSRLEWMEFAKNGKKWDALEAAYVNRDLPTSSI